MKYPKIFALIVLVSVMTNTAHARGDKLSLFHCGLKLGGTTKVHNTYSADKKSRGNAGNKASKSIDSNGVYAAAFTGATTDKVGRRRLPRTFTLANVGCSWR